MEQKMSQMITFKGKLPIGEQQKLHLSTNNGLTGYRISKFQIISSTPGATAAVEYVGKIYLTDQTGNIDATADLSDSDLLAVVYYQDHDSSANDSSADIILDKETFNQDIFVYITDAAGGTVPASYYIELEKFAIDLNTSTYHTLKNIRSKTQ